MTEQACQRIIEFALMTDMKSSYINIDSILAKIDNIFDFAASTSHRTKDQWDIIHASAKKWGKTFFKNFNNSLSKITEEVHERIIQRFDEHSNDIIQRAIKLERPNDPLTSIVKDVVKTNIKDFIRIALQEEVIKTAVNEVINEKIRDVQMLVRHEILVCTEKNELLTAAQRQVLIDISSNDIIQRGWTQNILYQLSIAPSAFLRLVRGLTTLPYQNYWNKFNSKLSHVTKNLYEKMDSMDSFLILTDEAKRYEFATEYLKRRRLKILAEKNLYTENLQLWIENKENMFIDNLKNNYRLALLHLTVRTNAYEIIKKHIKRFAEVECKLIALQDLAKFNGQHPVIDESQELGQGSHFIIYPAQWFTETNLAVKKLKQSSNEYAYLQYLEAHYHRKVTQLRLIIPPKHPGEPIQIRKPHVVPLLYLYEKREKNNEFRLYMFLPKYCQSLDKYLQHNANEIKADQIIKIALDMIDVLILLHANDIVHRDIKAKNILIDENKQCYLADFGTAQEWITNSTVVGTFPLPPEVSPGSIYDGTLADIYSFGIFLFELLPNKSYSRPTSVTDIIETLKTIAQLNEHYRIYENLIKSCLKTKSKDRPNAIEVKSKLLECKTELEKKSCIICEEKLRECRFQPCGHKVICQPCYHNLPKNFENKSSCILCKQIIDDRIEDDTNETFYK